MKEGENASVFLRRKVCNPPLHSNDACLQYLHVTKATISLSLSVSPQIWEMVQRAQRYLGLGYTSQTWLDDHFLYSYYLWVNIPNTPLGVGAAAAAAELWNQHIQSYMYIHCTLHIMTTHTHTHTHTCTHTHTHTHTHTAPHQVLRSHQRPQWGVL